MDAPLTFRADEVELVDDEGNTVGTLDRAAVHGRVTPRHRAFSVYLVDEDGRVLITRRALGKRSWPGVWSNACCGHPRPGEPDRAAIIRRVGDELGVEVDEVDVLLPDFSYTATDATGIQENELCPVYRARLPRSVELRPDPDETMEWSWVSWESLVSTATHAPAVLSPWAVAQIRELVEAGLTPVPAAGATPTSTAGVVPRLDDTLVGVEERLHENAALLETLWHELGADDDPVLALDLPSWLHSLLRAGGKRLRPQLCHWGFVAAGGTYTTPAFSTMIEAAAALELLHEFALIHDDVMDDSDLRRGRPSAHRQAASWHAAAAGRGDADEFGRNLAVLLGDLTLVEAQRLSRDWPDTLRDNWHTLCVELVLGQRGDLTGAAAGRRDREHAERISALKSAAYTVIRPLDLGALAAGAPDGTRETLRRYGSHAGAAFALRDDVLGVWGIPDVTGKPAGDDLREAKPTVLMSMAAERLTGRAAEALRRAGTPDAREGDVPLLQDAIIDAGVLRDVESMIGDHVAAAEAALDCPDIGGEAVDGLTALAAAMAWRTR